MRRFDHEMGEHLDDLLDLSRADVTSRRPGRRQEAVRNIHALKERILAIRELDARVPPLPPGLGNAIMEAFGLPPSRRIGDLRKLCEDAVERGELEERRDAAYYIDYLRAQGVVGSAIFSRSAACSSRRTAGGWRVGSGAEAGVAVADANGADGGAAHRAGFAVAAAHREEVAHLDLDGLVAAADLLDGLGGHARDGGVQASISAGASLLVKVLGCRRAANRISSA